MSYRRSCLSICLLVVLLLSNFSPAPALMPSALAAPASAPAASEMPLSQGKPSFASSSGCGDGGGCLTPDYANDGLDWTFWAAHTNVLPNYPHWWKVDLGATYNIGTLVADWYTSEFYPVQYRYRIEVSDDDQTFTTVLDRTDNTTTGQTVDRFSARGRWLRITIENGVLPDGGIGKDLSAYEFRVYQAGPLALEISDSRGEPLEELDLNQDGWPSLNADSGAPANPITVTVTIQNMTDVRQGYVTELSLGSSNNSARFYVSSSPCDLEFDQFSYTQIDDDCGVQLQPGETATFQWGLWIQPSAAATLVVSAKLRRIDDGSLVDGKQAELGIPEAQIHPLVFIHGILGSMPAHNLLVTDEDTMHWWIDPFLGVYWPLPDQLQKIGYEWNKTLFVLAYDWRRPIDRSADFLAEQLRDAVIPLSRPSAELPYTAPAPKADLIGHSMGGLVARSYIQRAAGYQNDVRKLIFVASPHKGFPFDYRTWEGLTWSNYLYDAPWYSGGVFGTFGKLMDNFIWPRLVRKSFRPTDGEFAQDCSEGSTLDVRLLFANSQGQSYTCSWNTIAKWSHTIDTSNPTSPANRGVRSLFEMLPTNDLALPADFSPPNAYLVGFAGEAYPLSRQENTYLRDLNSRIGMLSSRLGIANIYNIFGTNAQTDMRYQVGPDPDPTGPELWRYGVVTNSRIAQRPAGDDLIPASSMALRTSGLLPLPIENEEAIDDEASQRNNQGFARHKDIISQTRVQTAFLPQFLGIVDPTVTLPFHTDRTAPALTPQFSDPQNGGDLLTMLLVITDCPINLLITDPQGRRLGYDPASGQVWREIPDAVYTSPGVEPQMIVISQPLVGTYQIAATGYAAGGYGIAVGSANQADVRSLNFFSGVTANGQVNSYTFTYTPTATFPTTPIRDDFNRPDGPVRAGWAGDVQEYEIQSQALVPSGGSGAIYWDTPFGPDQEAYVTLSADDADADEIDLLLKGQGEGQCDVLEVWYQPRRSTVQVWTCHDFGTWTQHGPDIPVTFQAGDLFGARARADGRVEVYKNGALIGTVTLDGSWPYRASGGRIGLWTIRASAASLDGFGGGSLP